MKGKKNINLIIYFNIAILVILLFVFTNYTKIINKIDLEAIKLLDQEGQNYRLVTSADNVQVPVPKGYVASQVTGENYVTPEYQHTYIPHKGNYTELTWSSPAEEQYPWTQDSNGIWISGNQGIANSESVLESEEFDYIKGTTLTINYTYSSADGDYLSIYLMNLTNNEIEGVIIPKTGNRDTSFDYTISNFTYTMNDWATGRYKIKAIYSKNYSTDQGQDSGYIKPSTYFKEDNNGTESFEEDIKTKIHDGGFVIYQLTDEELEIDPNGTSVIINDTNKDTAQSTRNQYVWVPVQNIEDIVRKKTANNGIMQFGQNYIFSTKSITKEINTGTDYFREPRLIENYDKTKCYLQKYSNIDNRESYLNNMQEEYNKMVKSINKYKGFYIGRYETGDDYTHSSSKGYFINPRVIRYNSNIGYVTWYDSYKDLERLSGKTGKYVETGMLYDSLWDYTLKWLQETDARSYKDIMRDSGTWGNYSNNSFKYKTVANGTERTKNKDSSTRTSTGGITKITYKGEIYSNSPTASNNIFDIAGNVLELTRSRYSASYRMCRSGSNNGSSSGNPAVAIGSGSLNVAYESVGARGELLIK